MFRPGTCLLAILIGATALRAAEAAAPSDRGRLRLLTWNVQMLPTSVSSWSLALQKLQRLRAPWIIEHLNTNDYDVVVLQEVIDPPITEMLKSELKAAYPHIVAPPSKAGIAGTTGGILFASRVPIRYVSHIAFRNVAGIDRLAEKGCVLVELERGGLRCQIAGTHLQAGEAEVREREFPELHEGILKPHGKAGVPQLLAGDMNVNPEPDRADSPFARLLKITEMQAFPLDDPRPFTVDSSNSWNARNKHPRHIDHVLLNPRGTRTTIVRQTIIRPRREHAGRTIDLADHYGVVAEIVLKP